MLETTNQIKRTVFCLQVLVGGFNPSEKYESQLGNMWKNKIHVPDHQPNIEKKLKLDRITTSRKCTTKELFMAESR